MVGGAGFGGVFEVRRRSQCLSRAGRRRSSGRRLRRRCGAVLCGGKAAKAEQGFGVFGLGVGIGGWGKEGEGLPALAVCGEEVDLAGGDDAACGGGGSFAIR